ncbi:hypothetical protein [Parahalioglobus pacificus]|uniref:Shikimate kinase n=1 Tax=Parahalioglobus pacificus TaxID=930806 RepID=A0A918XJM8_9GAMM|nr:hypothetical protein [Halioglobus pacificus]NQY01721.1 hypothetical protein [Halieaceae bacterium]GHD33833.1 hypothetical protein GCM10007053_18820 [Halioglobus pacificus]
MTQTHETWFGSDARYRAFTAVKYITYLLLCFNVYLFLDEELKALEHTFTGGFELSQLIQVFASTIDTAAWVVLLLLFELETSVLDDSRLRGGLKWVLFAIRSVCYAAIVWAFTGYCAEWLTLHTVTPLPGTDLCTQLGQGWSLLIDIDEYEVLTAANCGVGTDIYQITGFDIVVDGPALQAAQWLAWTDVINAGAWILVVILLEVEVYLQLKGALTAAVMSVTKYFKYVLYATLFAAAAYWGYAGDFLDFWDASLWLFAFIFIELNVFEWQFETQQQQEAADAAMA